MRILFTGKNGFIGRNILEKLSKRYEIVAPSRDEMDLRDYSSVENYIQKGNFDVVCHFANPNPVKNDKDSIDKLFEDSLKIFMNLKKACDGKIKLIYLGSGAEYDKRNDLVLVKEEEFGNSIPVDSYGFSKYIMNELASISDNIYNLRIFGCYGPEDHDSKFIKHAISCSMNNQEITIRQNCYFDYLYVEDLVGILAWFFENKPKYSDYNVCTGKRVTSEEIAKEVALLTENPNGVRVLSDGFNKEYTADNSRLLNEMGHFDFTSLRDGIKKQIEWQRRI